MGVRAARHAQAPARARARGHLPHLCELLAVGDGGLEQLRGRVQELEQRKSRCRRVLPLNPAAACTAACGGRGAVGQVARALRMLIAADGLVQRAREPRTRMAVRIGMPSIRAESTEALSTRTVSPDSRARSAAVRVFIRAFAAGTRAPVAPAGERPRLRRCGTPPHVRSASRDVARRALVEKRVPKYMSPTPARSPDASPALGGAPTKSASASHSPPVPEGCATNPSDVALRSSRGSTPARKFHVCVSAGTTLVGPCATAKPTWPGNGPTRARERRDARMRVPGQGASGAAPASRRAPHAFPTPHPISPPIPAPLPKRHRTHTAAAAHRVPRGSTPARQAGPRPPRASRGAQRA